MRAEDQQVPVGIAARTYTAAIALPTLFLGLAEPVHAQVDCATPSPRPDSPAIGRTADTRSMEIERSRGDGHGTRDAGVEDFAYKLAAAAVDSTFWLVLI